MEEIILTLENDLITLGLLMAILGSLIIINTLLGSITSWLWGEWKTQKFWQGLLKNILIALCLALFFAVLEIMPFALERTGITIPSDFVKKIEVLTMLFVCIKKYAKDIYSAFMVLLGVSETDIKSMEQE